GPSRRSERVSKPAWTIQKVPAGRTCRPAGQIFKITPHQNAPRTGSVCRPGEFCVYRTCVSSQSAQYREKNQYTRRASKTTGAIGMDAALPHKMKCGYAFILVQIFTKVSSKYLY